MSFHSSIIFCANRDFDATVSETDIVDSRQPSMNGLFTLSEPIPNLLENEALCRLGDLSFTHEIEFNSWGDSCKMKGVGISLSGNGYFFPYSPAEIFELIEQNERLKGFLAAVQSKIGGHFQAPRLRHSELFRNYAIAREGSWALLLAESG
ncbi:MAG: hypothetical protein ACSHYA_16760 [Opitutaceae bacterium]